MVENIHISTRAKDYLKKRALKESTAQKRKSIGEVVDDLCFPKKLQVKGSVS